MTAICLYFRVHQPYRLKKYKIRDTANFHGYEDEEADIAALDMLAQQCYLPANEIIYQQILEKDKNFNVTFSISGVMLELFQKYRPDVAASFQKLVATGAVEILAETFYNSLSSLYSRKEFVRQVKKHSGYVKELFGMYPSVFRNTELIHNNILANQVAALGYSGLVCEGLRTVLNGRHPNQVYAAPGNKKPGLLLRHTSLSDDIAFRFDDAGWNEHPLTALKFANWLGNLPERKEVINLMLDYETFGIHKKPETGIFEFLRSLPGAVLDQPGLYFATPSMVLEKNDPADVYNVPEIISWEGKKHGRDRFYENVMQHNTLKNLYRLENMVLASNSERVVDTWGRLQAADYFHYMSDLSQQVIHDRYHNPFSGPFEAFENYSNLVADFEIALIRNEIGKTKKKYTNAILPNLFF